MKSIYAMAALLLLAATPASARVFKPLVLGDRVSGPADCERLALEASVNDFRLKNPACREVDERSSFVRKLGYVYETTLVVWGEDGERCGRFEGGGHRFQTLRDGGQGCTLELRNFLYIH